MATSEGAKRHFMEDDGWTKDEWIEFTLWLTATKKNPYTNREWELAAMEWRNF